MFKLIQLKHRTSHIAYLGGLAISPDFSGQAHDQKMLREIITVRNTKDLKRIELSVAVHNEKAIRLYQQCGFVNEGILRNYTFLKNENRYIDESLMSYLY